MVTLSPGRVEELRAFNSRPGLQEVFVFHYEDTIIAERMLKGSKGSQPFLRPLF